MSLSVALHKLFEDNSGKSLTKKQESSHQNSCPHYFKKEIHLPATI